MSEDLNNLLTMMRIFLINLMQSLTSSNIPRSDVVAVSPCQGRSGKNDQFIKWIGFNSVINKAYPTISAVCHEVSLGKINSRKQSCRS
ncbi:hypothetical protein CHS0354_041840 [Potamilus streckersoni]|uniref:Uncharacterized protein n=1 Tax=Potamilus streckersoni TaxID=2493646 RepID=A0AAE0T152_9BIVA|nr:hypothetical protein CHS0354_041840 [Potamilus streckersoni]